MKFFLLLTAVCTLSAQTPPTAPPQTVTPPLTPAPAAQPPALRPPPSLNLPVQPAAPVVQIPPETVVLTVGDEKLTKAQFDQILSTIPPQQRAQMQTPAGRKKVADQIADLMTLAQAAKARGIDKTPKEALNLELRVDQELATALYQELANAKPTDEQLHAYYDAHQKDFEEARARHILLRVPPAPAVVKPDSKDPTDADQLAKIKELRAKIVAGADFAEIAKTESADTSNAANGGDLGWFPHGRMAPAFDQAAFSLPVGEVSEPVKTQYGYHLIKVEERKVKPFEEARAEIEAKIKPDIAKQGLDDLKKKTTITYDESYFGK